MCGMSAWGERSPTQAAMLNPALLAVITAAASIEYTRASTRSMPWPLAFLVAPLVLHRSTREALPRDTRTHLAAWVAQHPVEHAGFARRAVSLRDPVLEGVRFGLANGALSVDGEGMLTGTVARSSLDPDNEVTQIVARAGFAGRWLAKLDQPATAFVVLGVAP